MQKFVIKLEPKPQSRPKFRKNDGRAYDVTSNWKRTFSQLLRLQRPKIIENGPIFVATTFYLRPPKSISKIDSRHPTPNETLEKTFVDKRPDIDNYIKAVLDASNGVLFKDDGQVAVMSAQKLYSLEPRIEVIIDKLESE